MDAGLKSLATCMSLLVLVEALTSSNAGLALVNLLLEESNDATLYGLWILSCRVHQANVVCGDQANDVQNLERTHWGAGANAPSSIDILDIADAVSPQLLSGGQKRYQRGEPGTSEDDRLLQQTCLESWLSCWLPQ